MKIDLAAKTKIEEKRTSDDIGIHFVYAAKSAHSCFVHLWKKLCFFVQTQNKIFRVQSFIWAAIRILCVCLRFNFLCFFFFSRKQEELLWHHFLFYSDSSTCCDVGFFTLFCVCLLLSSVRYTLHIAIKCIWKNSIMTLKNIKMNI